MAELIEFDQDMNLVTGRPALSLKIEHVVKIFKGEIPYSDAGLPVNFFSFDDPQLRAYIDEKFQSMGIQATTKLSQRGRITIHDTDLLYEGDL
jgi:hypothetical protein